MQELSKKEVVNILISAIDKELECTFLERNGIDRFRKKVLSMIERDYMANPVEISNFVKSIDTRLWALKMICHITFNCLAKKTYFGKNGITPTGVLYYDLYRLSINRAYSYKYIEQTELNSALRNLDDLVSCCGDIEFFQYNPRDNYLDHN